MGKKKRGKNPQEEKVEKIYDSDDEKAYAGEKQPDVTDDSFYHDEVDRFHANRDKILLDSGAEIRKQEDSSDNEDEVLGVGSDSEDDLAIAQYEQQLKKLRNYDFKDELASDLDDEGTDDEDPDDRAWGSARDKFYGADVGDCDKIDFGGDEPDTAVLEEQEALAIQKRMAQQIDEDDFDLDIFKTVKKKEPSKKDSTALSEEKIEKDLSQLSKEEKLKLLTKESPELLQLIEEYKTKMSELHERILPIQGLIRSGKLPKNNGADYIDAKAKLYLNYCVNISFYMMMKAKRIPIENHPVVKRIVQYRNLMKQMEPIDEKMSSELEQLLEKLHKGEDLMENDQTRGKKSQKLSVKRKLKPEKKSAVDSEQSDTSDTSDEEISTKQQAKKLKKEARSDGKYETKGERQALEYYEMLKAGRSQGAEEDGEDSEHAEDMGDMEGEQIAEEETTETDGKRAITYQMAKNKGLMPKRKKEARNPRVKNRMKYRKAKIRRKGQVREVRTEMTKYGGELSGIRAGITKSTKFK